jgi:hypothetical protein
MNQVPENPKQQKPKRKKLPLFVVLLLAGTGFFLARGVAAGPANDIVLNGATKMMGGDEIAVNACDSTISLTRTPIFVGGATNIYQIQRVTLADINQYAPAASTSTIGVEGCGNQVLQLSIFNGAGTLQQASWTIPSAAISNGAFYFDYVSNLGNSGANYADVTLIPFDPAQATDTKYAVRTYRLPY